MGENVLAEGAKWITFAFKSGAVYKFVKKFGVREGFLRAEIFVAAHGFYDFTVNGKGGGESFFKPFFTDYRIFSYYEKYDVTRFIALGENELRIDLAGGYYQNDDREEDDEYPDVSYGLKKVMFALKVYYDGGAEIFASDGDTLCGCVSAYTSTLFRGDRLNFAVPEPKYFKAREVADDCKLLPSPAPNDVISEFLEARAIYESDTEKIYDFGQNHTGGISCVISGERNDCVTVTYAETLNGDGTLNADTSAYPVTEAGEKYFVPQKNSYVLSGGRDKIEPLFSWRCYRYVRIESGKPVVLENLRSCFIHAAVQRAGHFSCSLPLFNEIYEKYAYTQLCNMHCGVPTDCPHREKLPYTGDGQITAHSMIYCFEAQAFLDKWLTDIIASAKDDGYVPNTAPDMGAGGGYFWGYAVVQIPSVLYRYTGNKEYLKRAYSAVLRWIDFLSTRHGGDYILRINDRKWSLGDWLAPEPIRSDHVFFDTVCYYASVKAAAKMHEELYGEQNETLLELARNVRAAINREYFDSSSGAYSRDEQGETVLALYYGIPEKENIAAVLRCIQLHYGQNGKHFDTGIVVTPMLLQCLRKYGLHSLAYELMTQTDYPSFAYMLKGETTFPEHWSKKWIDYKFSQDDQTVIEGGGEVSHCHPMFGSVVRWLYESVAGLDISHLYRGKVVFAPAYTDKIERASASVKTVSGNAAFAYSSQNGLEAEAQIPKNLTGEFHLPCGKYSAANARTQQTLSFEKGEFCLRGGKWRIIKL